MEEILVRESKRREEVFKNLPNYLKKLKIFLRRLDKDCKVFIFGSVVKDEHVLISDVDILILTKLQPAEVIAKLRENGFEEPFEFHVVDEKRFKFYKRFVHGLKEI